MTFEYKTPKKVHLLSGKVLPRMGLPAASSAIQVLIASGHGKRKAAGKIHLALYNELTKVE